MSNLLHSAVALGLWHIRCSHGRVLSEPSQLPHIADHDRPPAPTLMVEVPDLRLLAERQDTSVSNNVFTVTVAPDETCGWQSGSPGVPITCQNHQSCMWVSALGIICGQLDETSSWDVHLRCVEKAAVSNTGLCDNNCQSDIYYLRCTDASAPYCRTYAYPMGLSDFRCISTPESKDHSVSFTYDGQQNAGFVTTTYTVTNGGSSASSTKSTTSSSSTAPAPAPSPHSSSTNIGAIVGGAVGGFAALCLLAFAIFWFVRRSRKKKINSPVQDAPWPIDQDPMEQVSPNGTTPLDPNATAKTGPNSPVQSEWRGSMVTAVSSLPSHPASPEAWVNQLSPVGQNDVSPGAPQPPMLSEMGGGPVHHHLYEMIGDTAHVPVYEMTGDNRLEGSMLPPTNINPQSESEILR